MAARIKLKGVSIGFEQNWSDEVAKAQFEIKSAKEGDTLITVMFDAPEDDARLVEEAWKRLHRLSSDIAEVVESRGQV